MKKNSSRRMSMKHRQVQRMSLKAKLILGGSSFLVIAGLLLTFVNTLEFKSAKAKSSNAFQISSSSTKSVTHSDQMSWDHQNSNGTSQLMLVSVTTKDKSVTSVKYNNVSLTLAGSKAKNSMTVYLYYLRNPANGTHTISVKTSDETDMYGGAEVVDNADLTASFTSYKNSGNSSTVNSGAIPNSSYNYIFSAVGTLSRNPTPTGTLTTAHSIGGGNYNLTAFKDGDVSATSSFSLSASTDWAIVTIFVNSIGALPVSWKSFDVNRNDESVTAEWITASEINNDYFMLQKSSDGITFIDVSRIQGSGNKTTDTEYSTIDTSDPFSDVYYRVKQVDFDGKTDYSEIKFLKSKKVTEEMLIYPTVASDHINIKLADANEQQNYICRILDSSGKLSMEQNINGSELGNAYQIDVQELAKGNYIVVLESLSKIAGKGRFVKN